MKNVFKIICIQILLCSIFTECIFADVSDNDGSAFITNDFSDYLIQEIL